MNERSSETITEWIAGLRVGDQQAAHGLWARYFDKLVRLSRLRLKQVQRRVTDEEDIALSVFDSLCNGMAKGRFEKLTDRHDLWYLLLSITNQKVSDHIRHQNRKKRGGGAVRGDSVFQQNDPLGFEPGFDRMMSEDPTPEFLSSANEQYQRLLELLRDDELRSVALWRMEGLTNDEIGQRLGLSGRSVRRKVDVIRKKWTREMIC